MSSVWAADPELPAKGAAGIEPSAGKLVALKDIPDRPNYMLGYSDFKVTCYTKDGKDMLVSWERVRGAKRINFYYGYDDGKGNAHSAAYIPKGRQKSYGSFTISRSGARLGRRGASIKSRFAKRGVTWTFRIEALDAAEGGKVIKSHGPFSVVFGHVRPLAVKDVHVSSADASLRVAWVGSSGASGYHVYYGTSVDKMTSMLEAPESSTEVSITGLKNGTPYYGKVVPYSRDCEGHASEVWEAMPVASYDQDIGIEGVVQLQAAHSDATDGTNTYIPMIEDKPTVMRIFPTLKSPSKAIKTRLKIVAARKGVPLAPIYREVLVRDTSRKRSGNTRDPICVSLPQSWLKVGTDFCFELDPDNQLKELDEENNRFPKTGMQSLGFVKSPTLRLHLVPLKIEGEKRAVEVDEEYIKEVRSMMLRFFPTSDVRITCAREPFEAKDRKNIHWARNRDKEKGNGRFYVGLHTTSGSAAWVKSYRKVGPKTKLVCNVNFPGGLLLPHEIGHIHGVEHPFKDGSKYPYEVEGHRASLGNPGYDSVSHAILSSEAAICTDLMAYGSNKGVSDHTYRVFYVFETLLDLALKENREVTYEEVFDEDGSLKGSGE